MHAQAQGSGEDDQWAYWTGQVLTTTVTWWCWGSDGGDDDDGGGDGGSNSVGKVEGGRG
jgi:hypothetical protein